MRIVEGMLRDEDPSRGGPIPDWEFRFGPGTPCPTTLTGVRAAQLARLRELLPTEGYVVHEERWEELVAGLRELIAAGVSIDLLAAELRLRRAFVEEIAKI